jgi:hypothetical protein
LPTADSRMGEKLNAEEMAPAYPHIAKMGNAVSAPFVMPVAVYLASEACVTTHDMYSIVGGRVGRAFIGVTEGWLGPREVPPSVEDIASHIGQIRDETRGFHIPASLIDEFRIVADQIDGAG